MYIYILILYLHLSYVLFACISFLLNKLKLNSYYWVLSGIIPQSLNATYFYYFSKEDRINGFNLFCQRVVKVLDLEVRSQFC